MSSITAPHSAPFFLGPAISSESLIVLASAFWTLALNRPFLVQALRTQSASTTSQLAFVLALALLLLALHALLLGVLATRRTLKPLLALLTLVGAVATHYVQSYGVVIDPSMVRNALHTDVAEVRELLSWRLALDLALYGALPLSLLLTVRVTSRPWPERWRARALLLAGALGLFVVTLMWQFQPMAAMTRNHRTVRYLVTPANTLWSLGSVLVTDARGAAKPREPIGLDATPGPSWGAQVRPRLVVLVVGETARAANWGLSGYVRDTTQALARLPVVNFSDVTACGTSTEVSLPCMFAPVGRHDHDAARIQGSESLLHVAARAGVAVQWRDNQSGCKGVCDGLPHETLRAANAPGLCQGDRCWDEGLLRGLDERLAALRGRSEHQLLVLHMLGNHGPSYYKRYPAAFERFVPACRHDDLAACTHDEIVNAYDNALLYTDHVLATLVGTLQAHAAQVDTAVLFVSDHGESLGEKGLYLHGMPYVVAPREQTQVPMVMWWSDGFAHDSGLDVDCMRRRAAQPAEHDHLFHTVLGMLDVRTALYQPSLDLLHGCRAPTRAP
jgi:lipid A ethanolaminephosphotransferase